MNLLIVEDNESTRQLIKELLAELADAIYECGDGAEALSAYTRYRPDWVLMDIELELVDGLTATRQIKAVHPQALIVIVTQYNDPQLREAARAASAFAYVLKDDLLSLPGLLSVLPEHSLAKPSSPQAAARCITNK